MPENEFQKNNQELNKSNKTQEEINKKIKEGASLSKSMQDTLKKQADTLGKSEKSLKGMNSAAKNLNQEMSNVGKSTKKEASDTKNILTGRKALNAKIMEQVGFASKNAKVMNDTMTYQKKYQKALAQANQTFVRGTDASKRMNKTINTMRDQTRGMTDDQLKLLGVIGKEGEEKLAIQKFDASLIKNARLREVREGKNGKLIQGHNQGYADIVEGMLKTRQVGIDIAKTFGDIGKESFQAVDTEDRRKEILEEMESIGNRYFGANKKRGQELIAEKQTELDKLKILQTQSDVAKRRDELVKAGQKFITAPFEKLQGIMESFPGGGLMSTIVGVDSQMNTFIDDTRDALKGVFEDPSPENLAKQMDIIQNSGMKAITGLLQGFQQFFTLIGNNPMFALVAAIIAAGGAMKAFYGGTLETRKELGITTVDSIKLQHTLNKSAMAFKLMGVSAEDVKGISDGIMDNMGGVSEVTDDTVMGFVELNAHFGIAGEQAVQLAVALESVGAASTQAAQSQLESIGHLARQNGVAPAKIMSDMASDMEFFSSFAQQGGGNIAKAAISARKLGLNMASVSKMSESLLSFEESINAQMEAQVLTGKNINTDKARQMALAGDLDGMQREITKQVGTAAEFDKMNVVQRQALAQAFGVSVQDLSKMVVNQDKLNKMTDSQKKRQDLIADIMEQIGKAGTELMGAFKALIPLVIGVLSPFILIAGIIGGLLVGLGKIIGFMNELNVLGVGLGDVMMFAAGAALLFKGNLFGGMASGFKKLTGGISSVASKLTGGGAAGADGAAGGGMGKSLEKGGKGMGAGLKGLSKGVGAFANPKVILGLAAVTVALIGMGYALKLAAPGIKAFGEAMGTIIGSVASGISTIIGAIGDFAVKLMTIASPTMALGLFATAAGFTALAGSMAMFAGAGLLALPALLALTAFNAVTGAGGGGGGENTTDTLLKEQITELKKMNTKLDMVTSNTKKGADEAKSLNSSVIMA